MPFVIDHDRLLAALAVLPLARDEALRTLPAILTEQGEGHTTVSVLGDDHMRIVASNDPSLAEGAVLPQGCVVAAAAREGRVLYLEDAANDDRYWSAGRPLPVELAIPLRERGSVVAVLNIERDRPFRAEDRRMLEAFAGAVSERLTENSHGIQARTVADLSARLADARSLQEAASSALAVLVPAFGAQAGAILTDRHGSLCPLATYGTRATPTDRASLEQGIPFPDGLAWRACLEGEVQLAHERQGSQDGDPLHGHLGPFLLVRPVGRHGVRRTALALGLPADTQVSQADLRLLDEVCRHLAVIFDAVRLQGLQEHLLELHARIGRDDTEDLYEQVLDAAIATVPGAEVGTLLVRRSADEPFRFRAASGFDLEALRGVALEEHQVRAWHGQESEWSTGRARILSGAEVDLAEYSEDATGGTEPSNAAELDRVAATVCLPVTYRGRVLAVLNLDNRTRSDAFGRDSLRALAQFAPPVASLLAGAHYRDEIVRISVTDPVTGLPNRRGFEEAFDRALARAERSDEPLTVLGMDMTGFKEVNDALGHEVGDEALAQVGEALIGASRAGDLVARWGGDEFTALLPGVDHGEAERLGARLQDAVARLNVQGHRLGIDVGAASYPRDGTTASELLRIADRRMYRSKQARKSAASGPGGGVAA